MEQAKVGRALGITAALAGAVAAVVSLLFGQYVQLVNGVGVFFLGMVVFFMGRTRASAEK